MGGRGGAGVHGSVSSFLSEGSKQPIRRWEPTGDTVTLQRDAHHVFLSPAVCEHDVFGLLNVFLLEPVNVWFKVINVTTRGEVQVGLFVRLIHWIKLTIG